MIMNNLLTIVSAKFALVIIVMVSGGVVLYQFSQSQTDETAPPSQSSDTTQAGTQDASAQDEELRLKSLAGNGELIKITDQDKKDIAEWVEAYQKDQGTAFETIDANWNYDDPTGVWFAQKQLDFKVTSNDSPIAPPSNFQRVMQAEDMPVAPISLEQAKGMFQLYFPLISHALNYVNQYYPSRVPPAVLKQLTIFQQKDLLLGRTRYIGIDEGVFLEGLHERYLGGLAPSLLCHHGDLGYSSILGRLDSIASQGHPNQVIEIVPLSESREDDASWFSESKDVEVHRLLMMGKQVIRPADSATLIAGQVRIKVTEFEQVDENYVRKTVKYLDLLNADGSISYPFLPAVSDTREKSELLSYYDKSFCITRKKSE